MDLTELGQVKGEMNMAIVIAAANQKGGCSKTSVVANLGIGLSMKGKKVYDPEFFENFVFCNIDHNLFEDAEKSIISHLHLTDEEIEAAPALIKRFI